MSFSKENTELAAAITNIFETSRPEGNYAAVAVLDDGAGISYGIKQFTHRSGSLARVVENYLANGGAQSAEVLRENLPLLSDASGRAIRLASKNPELKIALSEAAASPEMRAAQQHIAYELYMKPAIAICRRYRFIQPLSLAVIYDSVVHGSFFRVARTVDVGSADEKKWIAAYTARRDEWLASYPRLRKTRYRTKFFLTQIAAENWPLTRPLDVHGVRLNAPTARPQPESPSEPSHVREAVTNAVEAFDKAEAAAAGAVRRADSVKSLWTTVGGTATQVVWGIVGMLAGIPREVWVTIAILTGCLMLLYLYRQIVLGRIRESA